MENNPDSSNNKKNRSIKSILFRIIFILIYSIILYFLYVSLFNFGVEPLIIFIILIFLILIVIGPLITGISRDMYRRLFQQVNKKTKEKSDYEKFKEGLKYERPITRNKVRDGISLDFKYKKSIIRKCHYCGMTVPNFVKKCPYCGKPILS